MAIDLSSYVRVINTHEKPIKGRFNGEDYLFKPGEPEDIHIAAAAHIFGFGKDDKSHALHGLGILKQSDDLDNAMAYLGKIKFEPVPDIPRIGSNKTASDAGPHVNAGGNSPETAQLASGDDSQHPDEYAPLDKTAGAPGQPSMMGMVKQVLGLPTQPSKRR